MADEPFELAWDGDDVIAALAGGNFDGLKLAAEHLLQVSSQLAPHDEGDLARSGEVSSDESSGAVAVSYDRPYAVRQHEDMTARHDEGKTAKYLENPMRDEADTMLALIARAARGPLGG
ncbi:hypothetical protein ACQPZJ_01750 [Actinoplanes sp. CA-054009]